MLESIIPHLLVFADPVGTHWQEPLLSQQSINKIISKRYWHSCLRPRGEESLHKGSAFL